MDIKLTRDQFLADGIFSLLEADQFQIYGLEHAFPQPDGSYAPKVPDGVYTCQRGMHRLAGMLKDFETFEIMSVPGHTGILFHKGNFNFDSDGCVLLGMGMTQMSGANAITRSQIAFESFMQAQDGSDQFQLIVISD